MSTFNQNFDNEQRLCVALKQMIQLTDVPVNTTGNLQEIQEEFKSNGTNSDAVEPANENSYPNHYHRHVVKHKNKKRENRQDTKHCVFCLNNNEPSYVYQTHPLRDGLGRILCPRLRNYTCPACGAFGDNAHTLRYCENRQIFTIDDTIEMDSIRRLNVLKSSYQFKRSQSNKKNYLQNSNNIRL